MFRTRFVDTCFVVLLLAVAVPIYWLYALATLSFIAPRAIPVSFSVESWNKLSAIGSLGGGLLTVIAGWLAYRAATMQVAESRIAEERKIFSDRSKDIYELIKYLKAVEEHTNEMMKRRSTHVKEDKNLSSLQVSMFCTSINFSARLWPESDMVSTANIFNPAISNVIHCAFRAVAEIREKQQIFSAPPADKVMNQEQSEAFADSLSSLRDATMKAIKAVEDRRAYLLASYQA